MRLSHLKLAEIATRMKILYYLIVAVFLTQNQTLTVTNADFVRLHRKYADRYVVIVIINKYKNDVKATAAKFNFPACCTHAKCLFRVRLHTKYYFAPKKGK
jgi:hypothetical protein